MALWPKILKCVSFRCCRWSEHVALHHPETRILDSETPNDCKGKKNGCTAPPWSTKIRSPLSNTSPTFPTPVMSLSFHQVIRDKRTGKTKGFLEEVDSQGDPAENSFQTRNSSNNRSFMVEKKDGGWFWWLLKLLLDELWMILAIQFNLRSGCSGSPLTG